MKVIVYGGSNYKFYSPKKVAECEKLGKALAAMHAEVLTGACRGYPYYTGRAAVAAGARVYGYSPAQNLKEHTEKYNFPADGVSDMVFNTAQSKVISENYLKRSIDMSGFGEVAVFLGGSWGTFMELLLSHFYKKTMIIIKEFDGAGDMFHCAYEFFGKHDTNPDVHFGAKIFYVKDVDEAVHFLLNLHT